MLKIKDSVDLKELEKFGFVKSVFQGINVYQRSNPLLGSKELVSICNRDNPMLLILTERGYQPHHDREYLCKEADTMAKFFDDLIQAGLVEKVEFSNTLHM